MNCKVGIIGYGKMGKIRHKAIRNLSNAKVVALSEPSGGVEINSTPNISLDNIIKSKDIDAIIICTPNYLNKDLTIKSLSAGKHVFCEKPPCFTGKDMLEIIQAEKLSGKKLMYGFNHRHHDSIMKMKRNIDNNEFGKILWMRGRYGKSVTPDYYYQWRAKKDLAGGGILIDQGIHMLDLFLHLGGDFDSIKAEISNLYWNLEVEDNAFVILKNSETGMLANLHSTMTQWRHLFSLEVFMEKGYMVLNGLNTSTMSYGKEVLSIAKNRSSAPAAIWEDEIKTEYSDNNSWRYEMEHFFTAIDNDTEVTIGTSQDALQLMKIMDKIYEQKEF
ncbi:MAG: Gfo/Idh/MocA family oxidoreductase [Bacteroidetes bacterium]|nr:Gfo/Idh/MocA family oxidoreductase [Bacteroidota bacterium]